MAKGRWGSIDPDVAGEVDDDDYVIGDDGLSSATPPRPPGCWICSGGATPSPYRKVALLLSAVSDPFPPAPVEPSILMRRWSHGSAAANPREARLCSRTPKGCH